MERLLYESWWRTVGRHRSSGGKLMHWSGIGRMNTRFDPGTTQLVSRPAKQMSLDMEKQFAEILLLTLMSLFWRFTYLLGPD
jgi:hypothetical protein